MFWKGNRNDYRSYATVGLHTIRPPPKSQAAIYAIWHKKWTLTESHKSHTKACDCLKVIRFSALFEQQLIHISSFQNIWDLSCSMATAQLQSRYSNNSWNYSSIITLPEFVKRKRLYAAQFQELWGYYTRK